MGVKRLYIFDMDGTFISTAEPDIGKKIWLEKTGTEWPFSGWWGRGESIDLDIFPNDLIETTYLEYKKAMLDEEALVVLMTGRHTGIRHAVNKLLAKHDLSFHLLRLKDGTDDTIDCKKRQISQILADNLGITEVFVFEDRDEHVKEFEKFFNKKKKKGIITNIYHVKKHEHSK